MIRSAYREDRDKIGELHFWFLLSNHNRRPIRLAMCDCETAQEASEILYTEAKEIHCMYCGQLLKTQALIMLTKDSKWIDSNSGKEFSVGIQDTTGNGRSQLHDAPSQIPRW